MQGVAEHAKWHDGRAACLFQKVIRWGLESPPFVRYPIRGFRKFHYIYKKKHTNISSPHRLLPVITFADCFVSWVTSSFLFSFFSPLWFLVRTIMFRRLNQPRGPITLLNLFTHDHNPLCMGWSWSWSHSFHVHENLTGCLENACMLACSAQPADCLLTDINEKKRANRTLGTHFFFL